MKCSTQIFAGLAVLVYWATYLWPSLLGGERAAEDHFDPVVQALWLIPVGGLLAVVGGLICQTGKLAQPGSMLGQEELGQHPQVGGHPSSQGQDNWLPEARTLVESSRRAEAIKLVQQHTGMGPTAAKTYVELLELNRPPAG